MSEMTYRDALNLALKEEMRRDPSVFVLGEDVALYEGSFKVTRGLLAEFGEERVKDTPISENAIIGVSVGAAMGGLRPVAELMTVNFALLAMDQIINHMAKVRFMFGGQTFLPMTIRMPGGGGASWLPSIPRVLKPISCTVPVCTSSIRPHRQMPRGCSKVPYATTTRSSFWSMSCSTTARERCRMTRNIVFQLVKPRLNVPGSM